MPRLRGQFRTRNKDSYQLSTKVPTLRCRPPARPKDNLKCVPTREGPSVKTETQAFGLPGDPPTRGKYALAQQQGQNPPTKEQRGKRTGGTEPLLTYSETAQNKTRKPQRDVQQTRKASATTKGGKMERGEGVGTTSCGEGSCEGNAQHLKNRSNKGS